MRVLTVRQPWAWAIIHGGKDVENRVRNIAGAYRGPVAIHAGLTSDWGGFHASGHPKVKRPINPIVTGAIIGVVDLVDVHKGHTPSPRRMEHVDSCFRAGKPYGPCSRWAEPHTWHLELANPRPLTEPIPFRGALGLRRLDDATRILVEAGIA